MVASSRVMYNEIEASEQRLKAHALHETSKPKQATTKTLPYDFQSKRRVAMTLVDLCTSYMQSIWPNQQCNLPLRQFVFEILRRSRIQYPVFQVALHYMARLWPFITEHKRKFGEYPQNFSCGRKVLIAALQVSSKFLQDHFYSADVWARISGLNKTMLQENEIALMKALNWDMFVSYEAYVASCEKLRVSIDSKFVGQHVKPNQLGNVVSSDSSSNHAVIHASSNSSALLSDAFGIRSKEKQPELRSFVPLGFSCVRKSKNKHNSNRNTFDFSKIDQNIVHSYTFSLS